jgi:hypothetical protein
MFFLLKVIPDALIYEVIGVLKVHTHLMRFLNLQMGELTNMPAPTKSFNFFTFIAANLLAWKYWGTVLNNHLNQLRKNSEVFKWI